MFRRVLTSPGRLEVVLARGIKILAGLVLVSGLGSGYRAIVPPELRVELVRGSPDRLRIHLAHSGRGLVDVRVELIERSGARPIGTRLVRGSRFPVFNPFPVRDDLQIELPQGRRSGSIARVTALPSTQWQWRPPTVVREIRVGGGSGS